MENQEGEVPMHFANRHSTLKEYQIQHVTNHCDFDSLLNPQNQELKNTMRRTQSKSVNIEFIESGEKIDRRTAVLILLSISFGVGYLFLPLSYFVKETWISLGLLFFNFLSGFIAVYMLMDLRAQVNLGSYQEVAYYMSGHRSSILGISILFALFFAVNCSVYLQLLAKFTQRFIVNLAGVQDLFPYSIQVIIVIEAAIMIPLCKVLNFQKIKYLTYPILLSVLIIFMCLVFNLVYRIVKHLNNDFCEIMEHNVDIPSARYGITYANVIPSLCYAFGFHIYCLQVHKVLDKPDPNGYHGMKMGLWTLSIMFILYFMLLIITSFYEEPHLNTEILYVFDVVFNAGTAFELVTQLTVIVQLFCHTPFVFYIAQEQVLMFYDEFSRKSVSKMIDEYKKVNSQGMIKYVTKEVTLQEDNSTCNYENVPGGTTPQFNRLETDCEGKNRVIQIKSYRLPYMTLSRKVLNTIFFNLFAVITLMALLQMEWFVNSVSIFGATCVPLSLYVIPGYYYGEFHRGYNKKKYLTGRIFAVFGVFIIIAYTALVFYSQANFLASQEAA